MNRAQRRDSKGKRFVADCAMCATKPCEIHVLQFRAVDPAGPKDLSICKGCPCAQGVCDVCGETGQHWLGCRLVGLPEAPPTKAVIQ